MIKIFYGLCLLLAPSFTIISLDREPVSSEVAAAISDKNSCNISVPNVFTPNGDGINDALAVRCECVVSQYLMEVFDDSGNTVYKSTNPSVTWDGSIAGKPVPDGYYSYKITITLFEKGKKVAGTYNGTLAIIR